MADECGACAHTHVEGLGWRQAILCHTLVSSERRHICGRLPGTDASHNYLDHDAPLDGWSVRRECQAL